MKQKFPILKEENSYFDIKYMSSSLFRSNMNGEASSLLLITVPGKRREIKKSF